MIPNEMAALVAAARSEYDTALTGAGWAEADTRVLRVGGRERIQWLHKLITADIEHLNAGQGTRGALLDAKGHFVADFTALVEAQSVLLLVDPLAKDELLNTLRRYIIREKVELFDESDAWGLFTLIGADSDEAVEKIFHARAPEAPFNFVPVERDGAKLIHSARARVRSTDILISAISRERIRSTLDATLQLTVELLEVLRIEAGLPRWGIDFDSNTLALEIPDVLSVRVDQGCYVGQEVVARIVHRGHVNRHLRGLKFEAPTLPARGDTIWHNSNQVGSITSVASSPTFGAIGLGYVRREVAEPGTRLRVASRGGEISAVVAKLPFDK